MGNLKDDIEEACRTHDIRDVIGHPKKKVILCSLPSHVHTSNTPSFSIYWHHGKQYWRCHGFCNKEGDIVDLIGELRVAGYSKHDPKKVREALSILDSKFEIKMVIPPKEAKLALSGSEWMDFLPPGKEVIEYGKQRGLAPETLHKFRIGQSKLAMAIPTFHEGRLMGIKFRDTQPVEKGRRFWSLKGSLGGLFNYDAVNFTTKPVLIVKGEIPVMLLTQMGYLSTAPTNGEGSWNEEWRTALALSPKLLIGDNDGPGRQLGPKRAAFFAARLVYPPDPFKDIDEYILAKPEEAVKQLDQWIKEINE